MKNKPLVASSSRLLLRWSGLMFLFTCALSLLIASRYLAYAEPLSSGFGLVLRSIILPAHFASLTALVFLPVLLAIAVVPRKAVVMPLCILLTTSALLVLLIDTQIYQLYRFHLNVGVFNLLFGGAATETFIFPATMYYQAGLIVVGVFLLQSLLAWVALRLLEYNAPRRIGRRLLLAVLISVPVYHTMHAWVDATGYEPFLEQTELLPASHGLTARSFLRGIGVEDGARAAIDGADDNDSLHYPRRPLNCKKPQSPLNIIFIVVDSWRFDALNQQTTPHMSSFAERGARFEDHHSGGNATRVGLFSLFYGIPGTYWHRMLKEQEEPVFIRQLRDHNYDLRVFRSAPLYSPEFDRTIFADHRDARMHSDGGRPAEWDADLTRDFLSYIDKRTTKEPFFALLFYDAPHSFDFPDNYPLPFQPSLAKINYFELDQKTDPTPFRNRYLNSVHYVDSLVGEVLESLESKQLIDNSVIVITGDHGQEFNDNGQNYWGHNSNYTKHQTQVPFVFVAPGLGAAKFSHRTSHFDVVPSLMQRYLGCRGDIADYSIGRDLFEKGGRERLVMSGYNDFAVVESKKITFVGSFGHRVFDLNYRRLRGGTISHQTLSTALEQISRFYAAPPR